MKGAGGEHGRHIKNCSSVLVAPLAPICKKCGGALITDLDGNICINCGAGHDENAELVTRKLEQPTEGGRSLFKVR